jgi:hypothetical protein
MSFYRTASTSALLNRALPTLANRSFAASGRSALGFQSRQAFGQRQKFAVSPTETGGHDVTLGDNETATISMNAAGECVVTIENKPMVADDVDSNGIEMPTAVAVVEAGLGTRRTGRGGQRGKMSWVDEPDGTIVFTPGPDELLVVTGDAIRASVVAEATG